MRLLHPTPIYQSRALGIVRIILGLFLIYHGQEVFHPDIMEVYFSWQTFQGPSGKLLAYIGKCSELLAGVMLFLGLLSRIGALLCAGTLAFVTFVVGKGEVWYGDQHPFLIVMFGILFFFTGPGAWSLDALLFSPGERPEDPATGTQNSKPNT